MLVMQTVTLVLHRIIVCFSMMCMVKGVYVMLFRLTAKWDATESVFHQNTPSVKGVNYGVLLSGILSVCVADQMLTTDDNFLVGLFLLLLFGVVSGCFLFATIMDLKVQKVYHFVWWIAGGAALTIWYMRNGEHLLWILAFGFLQRTLFKRFYGKADGHAFSVCGVLMVAFEGTAKDIWCHMILSYGLLILVQLCKGNIESKGKLKKPVPFIPYIWIAFGLYPGWFISVG